MFQLQIDYEHIKESWLFLIGILALTIITVSNEFKTQMTLYGLTVMSAFVLKFINYGNLPNLFFCFLAIVIVNYMINVINYFKMMNVEIERLSKVLEIYGRENLLMDIINSKDKIDAEFLISYYKIKIYGEKEKIISNINKIIIPENIKISQVPEIKERIHNFILYIKKEKVVVHNSVYVWGFNPSNSMVEFYIKLVNQRNYICTKNKDFNYKFRAYSVLRGLPNKFNPIDMLVFLNNESTVPDYKVTSEEYQTILNNTISGLERYLDIYKNNNYYFF